MPLPILVVDRHAAVEQLRQAGGIQRRGQVYREQHLGLVEQEAAIAVRAAARG